MSMFDEISKEQCAEIAEKYVRLHEKAYNNPPKDPKTGKELEGDALRFHQQINLLQAQTARKIAEEIRRSM